MCCKHCWGIRLCSKALVTVRLPVRRSDRLRAQASEHAILLAEPSFQTRDAREAVLTAMFEKQRPPAVFLAKNAVLASFATGRQTSLVVDVGHQCTTGPPHTRLLPSAVATQGCVKVALASMVSVCQFGCGAGTEDHVFKSRVWCGV